MKADYAGVSAPPVRRAFEALTKRLTRLDAELTALSSGGVGGGGCCVDGGYAIAAFGGGGIDGGASTSLFSGTSPLDGGSA